MTRRLQYLTESGPSPQHCKHHSGVRLYPPEFQRFGGKEHTHSLEHGAQFNLKELTSLGSDRCVLNEVDSTSAHLWLQREYTTLNNEKTPEPSAIGFKM